MHTEWSFMIQNFFYLLKIHWFSQDSRSNLRYERKTFKTTSHHHLFKSKSQEPNTYNWYYLSVTEHQLYNRPEKPCEVPENDSFSQKSDIIMSVCLLESKT